MERGYHGTGLKEILDSVHIPKGSFYNYFSSKEEFGAQVIGHYIEPFIQQLESHLEQQGNALSAMRRYFEDLIAELERQDFKGGCLLGNLMGEIGDTSELCRTALQEAVHRYRNLLQRGVEKAQAEGLVRSDKSSALMADLLVDGWQGALLRMKVERSTAPLKAFCDEILDDYLRG